MLVNTLELVKAAIAHRNAENEYIVDANNNTLARKFHDTRNEFNNKLHQTKETFDKDIANVNNLAMGLTRDLELDLYFGYDTGNTYPLRDYILSSKYVKDVDYKIYCEMNDLTTGPNALVIMNAEMLHDAKLLELIEACDGSGSFNGAEQ